MTFSGKVRPITSAKSDKCNRYNHYEMRERSRKTIPKEAELVKQKEPKLKAELLSWKRKWGIL
jgi:hypothetical protein